VTVGDHTLTRRGTLLAGVTGAAALAGLGSLVGNARSERRELAFTVPDLRTTPAGAVPGELPAVGAQRLPFGTLVAPDGSTAGRLRGIGSPAGVVHRLELQDGSITALGGAIIAGVGRYDGITGTYDLTSTPDGARIALSLSTPEA
jgi:hypothetical protein